MYQSIKFYISITCLLISITVNSQTISVLKNRFNLYLNFKNSLISSVAFTNNSVSIINKGRVEFTVFENEITILSDCFKTLTIQECLKLYTWKQNKHLSVTQLDSLKKSSVTTSRSKSSGLKGKRIAIDAGHFAGNMAEARIEQKFICFAPNTSTTYKDTIAFNEGWLTYNTAFVLKYKLEEQGAVVFVTRSLQNYTTFNVTYTDWFIKRKKIVLDSLLKGETIDVKRYTTLVKQTKEQLFWSFFRDYELAERSRIINVFKPDATIIIHYNVDEKNTDWIKPTLKNYTMTFIGGAMTNDNLAKPNNKLHFLRLLLSNQLNESEKLASLTVNEFSKQLNIPIAQQQQADYLLHNCIKSPSNGVYCRNLALCKTINSPLVYGEALYQDNMNECSMLNVSNYEFNSVKMPKRIYDVATCYYNAISNYFMN